jgi:hypothetical protein
MVWSYKDSCILLTRLRMMFPAQIVGETRSAKKPRIQRGHVEPAAHSGPEAWRNSGALGGGLNVLVDAEEVCRVVLPLDCGQAVVIVAEGGRCRPLTSTLRRPCWQPFRWVWPSRRRAWHGPRRLRCIRLPRARYTSWDRRGCLSCAKGQSPDHRRRFPTLTARPISKNAFSYFC